MLFFDWILALTDPTAKERSYVARFFRTRIMVFFADISMAIYLIHMLVLQLVGYIVNLGVQGPGPFWAILIVLPLTIFVGWLMTRFVEEPLAKLVRGDAGSR